jgi:ubiquitin-protein ligase
MSIKRIRKELSELWTDPPAFCRLGASPVTDPYHFEVFIDGPAGSPYAGGTVPPRHPDPQEVPVQAPQVHLQNQGTHCLWFFF